MTAEHSANKKSFDGPAWKFRGSIINFSMGWFGNEQTMRWALIKATEAGITIFAAAGNNGLDLTQPNPRAPAYPCLYPETVCITAVDANYAFQAHRWNYGAPVEYLAPGDKVLSLGIRSDVDLKYMSGTSMACPHAAGAAAIFVSWLGLTNNQAPKYVEANSLENLVTGVPPNTGTRLINTGTRSLKKGILEQFVWSGNTPVRNHDTNFLLKDLNASIPTTEVSSVASGTPLTGSDIESYTSQWTTTLSDATGLTTETGDTTWDPVIDEATSSTSVPAQTATPVPTPGGVAGQQVALASFIDPTVDPDAWKRLISYDSGKISVLIADILLGSPNSQPDTRWKSLIDALKSSGKLVVGRVDTGALGASEEMITTRLGTHDLEDWVSQIEADVDTWYRLYGSGLGGILFDGAVGFECGPDNMYSDLYAYINAYTKRRYQGAFTVLQTGRNTSQCYENTMDTLLTFTDSYDVYMSSYTPLDWTPADPRKIWHIIDSVPANEVGSFVTLAGQRGVGLIEVTDRQPDRPYATLPDEAYMQSLMDSVHGGSAPVTDAPAAAEGPSTDAPESLAVTSYGYSSVSLSWNPSTNAVGYNVYLNEWQVLSLPSYMTQVTVGDIPPGLANIAFSVKAIGGGNVESEASNSVSVSALSLPGGKPIINLHAEPQDYFTTYSADVLLAYSSLRVFVTYSQSSGSCDYQNAPAWPIYYNPSSCYCGVAMVQNGNLYRYNGTITNLKDDIPWSWDLVGPVPITRTGYTFTWVAPIGSSTRDTTSFVIQARGHGPDASVFAPCPKAGDRPDDGIFCA